MRKTLPNKVSHVGFLACGFLKKCSGFREARAEGRFRYHRLASFIAEDSPSVSDPLLPRKGHNHRCGHHARLLGAADGPRALSMLGKLSTK